MEQIFYTKDGSYSRELTLEELNKQAHIGDINAINELIDIGQIDIDVDTTKILKMILGRK
jgi:hypothetical protein